jgi:hypothetical protein
MENGQINGWKGARRRRKDNIKTDLTETRSEGKGKAVLVLNQAARHEDVSLA